MTKNPKQSWKELLYDHLSDYDWYSDHQQAYEETIDFIEQERAQAVEQTLDQIESWGELKEETPEEYIPKALTDSELSMAHHADEFHAKNQLRSQLKQRLAKMRKALIKTVRGK